MVSVRLIDSYRALDLTDEKGAFCGALLADLGVDVIKVERAGGDLSRNIGPFYKNIPHPERSLHWYALNANKRSITLNLESEDGKSIFRKLLKQTDIVVESFSPGYMTQLGLDYDELSQINPRVVMASVSPFGQDGPYREYKGSDLTVMAEGGFMYINGDVDSPPVRISVPQAFAQASVHAAIGILIALYQRQRTGTGDYVDVSAQAAVMLCTMNAPLFWKYDQVIERRMGRRTRRRNLLQTQVWHCKDGDVTWRLTGGPGTAKTNIRMIEWLKSEGKAGWLDSVSIDPGVGVDLGTMSQAENDAWEEVIEKFFLSHTKAELYEGALKYGQPLCPVNTLLDVVNDPQLSARGFWIKEAHDELGGEFVYPGPLWQSDEVSPHIVKRAPLIGENNIEIYKSELGMTDQELRILKERGVI